MFSVGQASSVTGVESGTILSWERRYRFYFDAFGRSEKYRWSLSDVLTLVVIKRFSADFGCKPPVLVDRINMVAKDLRKFVDKFKPLDSDKPLPGPWLVLMEDRAELADSPETIAAVWRAQWDRYPNEYGPDENFLAINIGALLVRIRHNLKIAGAEIE